MTESGQDGFFDRVYEMVAQVPAGMVATYGQIAKLVGEPRKARYVGFALHVNPPAGHHPLPSHRVRGWAPVRGLCLWRARGAT